MILFLKVLIGLIVAFSLFDLFFIPEYTYRDAVLDRMKTQMLWD